jgi:hypothetical protein
MKLVKCLSNVAFEDQLTPGDTYAVRDRKNDSVFIKDDRGVERWFGRGKFEGAGDHLSASEALFGFVGWLTTRPEQTVMSRTDDCAPIVELIGQFCDENALTDPRDGWENNLIHPKGRCSGGTL